MSSDFVLVLGIIFGALSVPPLIGAFSSSRPPRTAIILMVISGGMIVWANFNQPSGYSIDELPGVFTRVIAQIIR